MRRLLLLGCARRKHKAPGPIPAWYRYDGVLFRLCKRMSADGGPPRQTQVRILSAEFGVLTPETPIPWYDRRLDPERAAELRPSTTEAVLAAVQEHDITEVYLALGRTYRAALGALPAHLTVRGAPAPIGCMQADLRRWLAEGTQDGTAQIQLDLSGAPCRGRAA